MPVEVSEQLINMMAVFMVVSLAAERVVQVLKNFARTLFYQKTEAGKAITPEQAVEKSVDTDGDWAKFWPRLAAVAVGVCIAYLGRHEIAPLLPKVFSGASEFGWREAFIIGLFSAAGSYLWSQLLGLIKDIKEAKKLDLQKSLKYLKQ